MLLAMATWFFDFAFAPGRLSRLEEDWRQNVKSRSIFRLNTRKLPGQNRQGRRKPETISNYR